MFITVRNFVFPPAAGKWHVICILPSMRVRKLTLLTRLDVRQRASTRLSDEASTRAVRTRLKSADEMRRQLRSSVRDVLKVNSLPRSPSFMSNSIYQLRVGTYNDQLFMVAKLCRISSS